MASIQVSLIGVLADWRQVAAMVGGNDSRQALFQIRCCFIGRVAFSISPKGPVNAVHGKNCFLSLKKLVNVGELRNKNICSEFFMSNAGHSSVSSKGVLSRLQKYAGVLRV